MKNKFDTLGVMIDMSRNAVMNLNSLKRFLRLIARMGYNCVMLYTEDTYEVDGEPYFGYLRGRYSKSEMKEIDAFAANLGITVIPCIQTLAHLNCALRWGKYPVDCNDILLTGDDRTYELIDHMFATLSGCFASRKIHIGMDEAHMLGRGKYLDRHGYEAANIIMKRHLDRVLELAKKYDYEVMVWSDMFFRPWNNGNYRLPKKEIPKEFVESFPKSVIPVYWDYYNSNEQAYSDMLENHRQLSDQTWFAGGVWCWKGMIPHNRASLESMIPAMNACEKNGIRNLFFTMWGDDGAECSRFSTLPALFYLAEYARGNTDETAIKAKFEKFSGVEFDAFMQMDLPNNVIPYEGRPCNPSKYMFYSDCFNGYLDYTIEPEAGKKFFGYAETLHATAKKSRRYGYVFESAARLCDVMAIKYDLGYRTRQIYQTGDKEALKRLAQNEYMQVERLIERFAEAFEKQWMKDNKPYGFDVQDLRIGGLLRRIRSCRLRLLDFANGKAERIDELEEKLLPYAEPGKSIGYNKAVTSATVNFIHHDQIM